MTKKQAEQFNRMRAALIRISKNYMTPDQMRREHECGRGIGPSYAEEVEMAYENIQWDAARAVKGVKQIKSRDLGKIQKQTRFQDPGGKLAP